MALTKPRREETLESTWRAITEGREHHLWKSDTWDTRASREDRAAVMRESSGNFSGGGSCSPPSWTSTSTGVGRARLRREPSPGQEELNRRVEEFIEKFNEEMRLQRQKSLQKLKVKISSDTTH
ncbi:hypothetical protein Cni_G13593 [Canna indica]|uniref:Uncharacterized protein n=1 Tax=Canna indica TaxID=4628 RepID=A0AAQ3KG14_9LILI|nr:hypothetical protein Cni_G13593 [Canna indica]